MTDINRLVEVAYSQYFKDDKLEFRDIVRRALLEYGAIVREECAKEYEKELAVILNSNKG